MKDEPGRQVESMTIHQNPVNVYLSYVDEDEPLLQSLERHLSLLKRQRLISTWDTRQIIPGTHRANTIDLRLEQASIILLLISADFLASNYCYEVEMKHALQRHEAGLARVIPILARPCNWSDAPFAHIQVLPVNTRPITSWRDRNEAWTTVVQGIRQVIEDLGSPTAMAPYPIHPLTVSRDALLSEVWNVPRRHNAFFTGRDHVMQQLADGFRAESGMEIVPPQAIIGLAGMGKTQMAAEYAYHFRKDYRAVLWVRAQTQEDLITDFKTIARLLKLQDDYLEDRAILMQTMQRWFKDEAGWLLIFDNADDFALVEPFIPQVRLGHVLLTTRAGAAVELAQPLELQSLTVEDGALCLLRRAGLLRWNKPLEDAFPAHVSAASELVQQMNGLPLALEQAGAYVNDTKCGIIRYRDLYNHYRAKLQQVPSGMVPDYAIPVAPALMLSSLMVGRQSVAFELLQLCAFLAPEGIPDIFVELAATVLGPGLSSLRGDPTALDQAIRLLVRYSLLEREELLGTAFTTLSLHRILQLVLLDEMDSTTRQIWAERVARGLLLALETMPRSTLQPHIRQCLDHIVCWHLSVPEAEILQRFLDKMDQEQNL